MAGLSFCPDKSDTQAAVHVRNSWLSASGPEMPISEGNVIVRRAGDADVPGILHCLAAAFEPYRASYTPAGYLDTVLTAQTLQLRLASMQIFVAVSPRNQIAGTIACSRIDAGEGHLRGMAVLPEWQSTGVAERLLQAAEAELVTQHCTCVTLDTTEPLQRAMPFYERHGYRRSGKISDFFGMRLHEYVKELRPTSGE